LEYVPLFVGELWIWYELLEVVNATWNG